MESGDMEQMLRALNTMRGSMGAVAKVPEFVGVADKVSMLESRVKDLAVPDLTEAISGHDSAPLVPLPSCLHTRLACVCKRTDAGAVFCSRHLGHKPLLL
jgi:hypothetical protein